MQAQERGTVSLVYGNFLSIQMKSVTETFPDRKFCWHSVVEFSAICSFKCILNVKNSKNDKQQRFRAQEKSTDMEKKAFWLRRQIFERYCSLLCHLDTSVIIFYAKSWSCVSPIMKLLQKPKTSFAVKFTVIPIFIQNFRQSLAPEFLFIHHQYGFENIQILFCTYHFVAALKYRLNSNLAFGGFLDVST